MIEWSGSKDPNKAILYRLSMKIKVDDCWDFIEEEYSGTPGLNDSEVSRAGEIIDKMMEGLVHLERCSRC